MSSRKSDNIGAMPRARGWLSTLLCNGPLPVLLMLALLAGLYIDNRDFVDTYNRRMVMLVGISIMLAVSLQLINGFSGQFSLGHAGFMAVGAYMASYPAKALSAKMTDPASSLVFFAALGLVAAIAGTFLLLVFLGMRSTRAIHRSVPAILIVGLLIWLMIDLSKASTYPEVPARFVWSKSFLAVAKLFNWVVEQGQPLALKLTAALPEGCRAPMCYLVLVIGAGCCAGVVGLVVGMPALRLRGDYLAIATLGMAEIIRIIIQNSKPLGGALGLSGIPRAPQVPVPEWTLNSLTWLNARFGVETAMALPRQTNLFWIYGGAVITVFVIWRLAYSAKGRAIMAVREDEIAAAATGIDTTHHKVVAFVIGAFFAGVAGAQYAMYDSSITPSFFNMQKSIEIVVMVTLGGLGSISGAILAAIVLTLLPEMLRQPPSAWPGAFVAVAVFGAILVIIQGRRALWSLLVCFALLLVWQLMRWCATKWNVSLPDLRMVIYSLMLIFMMLLRPQGLLGGKELFPRRRAPRREAVATEDRDDMEIAAV